MPHLRPAAEVLDCVDLERGHTLVRKRSCVRPMKLRFYEGDSVRFSVPLLYASIGQDLVSNTSGEYDKQVRLTFLKV